MQPLTPCPDVTTSPAGERILAAAARLFYERGITATGVDAIVDEAGTTKRTLYQRFGSKDSLVAAYLQQRAHRWQSELLHALDGQHGQTALDVVYDRAMVWAVRGGRGCAFTNAWAEASAASDEVVQAIRAEKTWMRQLFTQIAGGDPSTGAVLHLLHEGAQSTAAILGKGESLEEARTASHRLLGQ